MELRYKDWDSLNINKYQQLIQISNSGLDAIDTEISIIALLCDCSEDDILNLPIPEYQQLRQQAQWIAVKPDVKAYAPKTVKLNNEYDVYYDVSKLTTAQYIDYQNYLKLNDLDKYLPYILAVFLVPKGKQYGDVPVEDVVKDISENLSIKVALSMCFFFTVQLVSLVKITLHYSELRLEKMMKTENNPEKIAEIQKKLEQIHSLISGVGLTV